MLCDECSHDVPMFPIFAVLGAAKKFHVRTQTCQKEMSPNMPASRARPNNPKQTNTRNSHLSQSNVEDSNATIFTSSTSGPAAHVMLNTYHRSPPFIISHTKKNIAVKVIWYFHRGTHKLAKITTFGPTGSEVCRLQVQARHKMHLLHCVKVTVRMKFLRHFRHFGRSKITAAFMAKSMTLPCSLSGTKTQLEPHIVGLRTVGLDKAARKCAPNTVWWQWRRWTAVAAARAGWDRAAVGLVAHESQRLASWEHLQTLPFSHF